jgi:CheY-like chemotaxis protein
MRKRILVVAQETALRAKIARVLQAAGYAVELAASEKRAIEVAAHGEMDAAIAVPGILLQAKTFSTSRFSFDCPPSPLGFISTS